jgi:hypothetical protein
MPLTCDQLLLGGTATHTVEIPPEVLRPHQAGNGAGLGEDAESRINGSSEAASNDGGRSTNVVLRPLLLSDVQQIHQAAKESRDLASVLMVQQALVEPKVTLDDVNHMHAGLVEFLLHEVNRISGLSLSRDELEEMVQAPVARACFVLGREFGWTPDECARLTVGQVLLYLELLGRGEGS